MIEREEARVAVREPISRIAWTAEAERGVFAIVGCMKPSSRTRAREAVRMAGMRVVRGGWGDWVDIFAV